MRPHPSTPETSRKNSLRANAVLAIAIAAGVVGGLLGPDLLKSGEHKPESAEQMSHDLDRDWTRLADKMEAIAHHTTNPRLIVEKRRTDITGGTGVGAEATVITIKDGSYGQAGGSDYGFSAKVVEQSKDPQSLGVPPFSSFNINIYGHAPEGLPFKSLIGVSREGTPINGNSTQTHSNNFSFSMNKDIDQTWSLVLQSNNIVSGITPAPYNQEEPIDPGVVTSLMGQLSEDIIYLLNASNTPSAPSTMPTIQS